MANITCKICFGPLQEKPYKCPFCESEYHKDHFAAWLFMQPFCPVCRSEMPSRILAELAPRTQEEAEEMTQLYNHIVTNFKNDLAKLEEIAKKKNKRLFWRKKKKVYKQVIEQEQQEIRQREKNDSLFKRVFPLVLFLAWMTFLVVILYY